MDNTSGKQYLADIYNRLYFKRFYFIYNCCDRYYLNINKENENEKVKVNRNFWVEIYCNEKNVKRIAFRQNIKKKKKYNVHFYCPFFHY